MFHGWLSFAYESVASLHGGKRSIYGDSYAGNFKIKLLQCVLSVAFLKDGPEIVTKPQCSTTSQRSGITSQLKYFFLVVGGFVVPIQADHNELGLRQV